MKFKAKLKKTIKKNVKVFKRALIYLLPRGLIEYLKVLEKNVIYLIKSSFYFLSKKLKDILWCARSKEFNKNEFFSKPFTINKNKNKSFIIKDIESGIYEIAVSHNDHFLYANRNSFYATFDFTVNGSTVEPLKEINLKKRESKTGLPFEYLGGGVEVCGQYKQIITLELKKDIKHLKISFKTQFDRNININEVVFLDITPLALSDEKRITLRNLPSSFIVYGDININTIDGSSIWLASLVNIVSRFAHVILLSKDNLKTENNILRNITNTNVTILYPNDFRHYREFTLEKASDALKILDSECPVVSGLITRGFGIALEIQKDKAFSNRKFVYVTDFYLPEPDGFKYKYTQKEINELLYNTDYLLYQTREIKNALLNQSELSKIPPSIYFPPAVDSSNSSLNIAMEHSRTDGKAIRIGYAGKIQPNWGVLELIEQVDKLVASGLNIELHIASGKLSDGDGSYPGFKSIINQHLKQKSFITFYQSLSRQSCRALMSEMDYVWCYRPGIFENATLEVSTKLIEAVADGCKAIVYPSLINKELLGGDYPYYLENPRKLETLLIKTVEDSGVDLSNKIKSTHSFDSIANSIKNIFLSNSISTKKVLFAGNDFKFIYPFISYLKRHQTPVLIDSWNWGGHSNLSISERKLEWADIVFCEWGLANAVWYSQNNINKKPLFIRIHAQEVRPKARKFAENINVTNVTKFVFVSETIRDKAIELYSWPREKTVVIPNFVEEIPFEKKDITNEIKLGMVGIVPQTKRLDLAIDLIEELLAKGKNASLHIKGHRPENLEFMLAPGRVKELDYYNSQYARIEANPILKENIHFYDWGNDVPLWYKKINVILSPSDNESFHYALADGVMSGALPVVWPWEGAEKVYPSEWITDGSIDSAIQLIENHSTESLLSNKELLKQRYGKEKVYKMLQSIIFNEDDN